MLLYAVPAKQSIKMNLIRRGTVFYVFFRLHGRQYSLSTGETEVEPARIQAARIYLSHVDRGQAVTIDSLPEIEAHYWLWHKSAPVNNRDTRPTLGTARNYINCFKRLCDKAKVKGVAELRQVAPSLKASTLGIEEGAYVPLVRNAASLFNRRFLAWSASRGVELVNPLTGFIPPVILQRRFVPSEPGFLATLDAAAKRDLRDKGFINEYLLFRLTLGVGMRVQEACHVKWKDVAPRSVAVETTSDHHGKSRKGREVPVSSKFLAELEQYRSLPTNFVITDVTPPKKSKYGRPPRRADRAVKRLTKWLRANGVKKRNPNHWLRKSFGSEVTEAHSLFIASNWLGHRSIVTTEQIYAGVGAHKFADVI